MLILKHILAPN